MMRFLIVAGLLLVPGLALAQESPPDPASLVPADQRLTKMVVEKTVTITVDKRLAREPKLPPEEPQYQKVYDEAGVIMEYAMDVKLSTADSRWFVLRCDSGGSNDPQCVFSTSQNPDTPGAKIAGTFFVIPGDGCVYSGGHNDNMFDARKLDCLKDGNLQPVAQPFSYAGFRSKAMKRLALYSDKNLSSLVTTIEPGAFVEVVLQDGDFFLLRDGFGLTGWAKLDQSQQNATEIEGFFYAGD
ncbi:MAG TPA: hypothetical protein VMT54_22930 [Candidatus Cybelea sp.]|nr:hypothetical protein [Candidatus Cybelea sp.]